MIKLSLGKTNFEYEKFNFPTGEPHIVLPIDSMGQAIDIGWEYERTDEILDLMLIHEILEHHNIYIRYLTIPYLPFSRADRRNIPNECFSLRVIANIINFFNAEKVFLIDVHSDVSIALIKNSENLAINFGNSGYLPKDLFEKSFYLISPDAGALKKVNKFAHYLKEQQILGVVECSKKRNIATGEITGTQVNHDDFNGNTCVIVDDICDGGRTFIEIAKVLKKKNSGKIILLVTHGFFTKGLEVFDGLIDEIYTRKGKIK